MGPQIFQVGNGQGPASAVEAGLCDPMLSWREVQWPLATPSFPLEAAVLG